MALNLVTLVDRIKADSEEFWLSPTQWRKSTVPQMLIWKSVRFSKTKASSVPVSRGVYSFVIACCTKGLPQHGYLVYVGETGNTSKETLRSRFLSYFSEMKDQSRSVHYVLRKYQQYLYFQFCEVHDKRRNLRKVEESLCDALIPPYNVRDFSADMRAAKRAF